MIQKFFLNTKKRGRLRGAWFGKFSAALILLNFGAFLSLPLISKKNQETHKTQENKDPLPPPKESLYAPPLTKKSLKNSEKTLLDFFYFNGAPVNIYVIWDFYRNRWDATPALLSLNMNRCQDSVEYFHKNEAEEVSPPTKYGNFFSMEVVMSKESRNPVTQPPPNSYFMYRVVGKIAPDVWVIFASFSPERKNPPTPESESLLILKVTHAFHPITDKKSLVCLTLLGQIPPIGKPFIKNFPKKDYGLLFCRKKISHNKGRNVEYRLTLPDV